MKAMILAAGLGTRLKPVTDSLPKALVPVAGRPAIEWLILKMIRAGIRQIIINVHHFAEKITDFVHRNNCFGIDIQFSRESDQLLDTGGGLKKASWFLNGEGPFLLHNVDVLSNISFADMLVFHQHNNASATLFVQPRTSSRQLLFTKKNQLAGWKNTISGETIYAGNYSGDLADYAFNGIHIINPEIFDLITEKGAFSIITTYLRLACEHRIMGYSPNDIYWCDIGKPESLQMANHLALKIYCDLL